MSVSYKQRAYNYIRKKVFTGSLKPGSRVSDLALAEEIGISRTPVREAISQLNSEGLLEQVPHFGAFVRKFSRHELQEIYDLREVLESYAAEKAAERLTQHEIEKLQVLCDQLNFMLHHFRDERIQSLDEEAMQNWVACDVAFHMFIVKSSGNRKVAKIIRDFRVMTNICTTNRADPNLSFLQVRAKTWKDHIRILRSFRKGKAKEAGYWMAQHIRDAAKAALRHHDALEASQEVGTDDDNWAEDFDDLISRIERYQSLERSKSKEEIPEN